MGRKPTGLPRGRPKIDIDKKQFENACALQCTLSEIASLFDCSTDTIERWCKRVYGMNFADTYIKKSERGKMSLRRMQFQLAEKSATMAIWLGKQWLGQRDKDTQGEEDNNELKVVIERKVVDLSKDKKNGTDKV